MVERHCHYGLAASPDRTTATTNSTAPSANNTNEAAESPATTAGACTKAPARMQAPAPTASTPRVTWRERSARSSACSCC